MESAEAAHDRGEVGQEEERRHLKRQRAEAGPGARPAPGRRPCKWFAQGACRWGSACKLSHDPAVAAAAAAAAATAAAAGPRPAHPKAAPPAAKPTLLRAVRVSPRAWVHGVSPRALVCKPCTARGCVVCCRGVNALPLRCVGGGLCACDLPVCPAPPPHTHTPRVQLVSNDMRREASMVLQCLRYIVRGDFFCEASAMAPAVASAVASAVDVKDDVGLPGGIHALLHPDSDGDDDADAPPAERSNSGGSAATAAAVTVLDSAE